VQHFDVRLPDSDGLAGVLSRFAKHGSGLAVARWQRSTSP
jgi:hypothetical protein